MSCTISHTYSRHNTGFTLVELSIVLVIIGLVVGGALVGQDLIRAAELRTTIAQTEAYNTAVSTFRTRYNAFPGDMVSTSAAAFGFTARSGAAAHGDGDGLLDSCNNILTPAIKAMGCETALFWSDLSSAQLINGSFKTAIDDYADTTSTPISSYLPAAKLGHTNYFTVYESYGINYFVITGVKRIVGGAYDLTNNMSPQQAWSIDQKIDDGYPLTGRVLATDVVGTLRGAFSILYEAPVPGVATCVYSGDPQSPYNTSTSALANSMLCRITLAFN